MYYISVYGEQLKESHSVRFFDLLFGERELDMFEINKKNIAEFFGIDTHSAGSRDFFIGTNEVPITVNLYKTTVSFSTSSEEMLYKIKAFIEKYYQGQSIGLKFNDSCDMVLKNGQAQSIVVQGKEICKGIFDNLNNIKHFVI